MENFPNYVLDSKQNKKMHTIYILKNYSFSLISIYVLFQLLQVYSFFQCFTNYKWYLRGLKYELFQVFALKIQENSIFLTLKYFKICLVLAYYITIFFINSTQGLKHSRV